MLFRSNSSTANWLENSTNYSYTALSYVVNKSDTIIASLICQNSTNTSAMVNSTAYTTNNTAPYVTAPSVTWDTTIPNANSILTCNNGTYADTIDNDAVNSTFYPFYQWQRNGSTIANYYNQTLNVSYLTAVAGGENFSCSWTVNDTGYQPLPATNMSANISLGGGMPVTGCVTITVPGRYTITQDILGVDPADYCIILQSSNIELDGLYHTIRAKGKSDDDYIGIYIWAGGASARQSGFNITNMTLIGWNNPIIGTNVDNVSFKNLNISDNQSAAPPPDIAACQSYYGCITMWNTNNSYYQNINCTQSNVCGKGFLINNPGAAWAPWRYENLTMKNIRINSTNDTGITISNTTNVWIQDVNMTDLNVSGLTLNRCDNFTIFNVNMSSMTDKIATTNTGNKAALLLNNSNGTISNFRFSDSAANLVAVYVMNGSRVRLENSTIISSGTSNATINVSDSAVLNMTNVTYTCGNCFDVSVPRATWGKGANMTMWQPVSILVTTVASAPLQNAIVNLSSNKSVVGNDPFVVIQNNLTSATGYTTIYNGTEFIMNNTRSWYLNNHVANASLAGYTAND